MSEPTRLPIVKIAAASAALAATATFAYYMLRKRNTETAQAAALRPLDPNLTPFERAKQLKERGNALFSKQNYQEAKKLFDESVEVLKTCTMTPDQQQLLSTVYNNLSATSEFQNDLEGALDYTKKALDINKDYTKVYLRRARIHRKLKKLDQAVLDGGYCLRLLQGTSDKALEKVNREFLEDLSALTAKNIDSMFKKFFLTGQFLPISRLSVEEWTQKLAIHDPLLERLDNIKDEATYLNNMDQALQLFIEQDYIKALEQAVHGALNKELSVQDQLLCRLFAARIYLFAGLYKEVQFMTVNFTALWDKQSNEWQAEHRHLLLAFWALDVYLDPIDTTEAKLLQNSELLKNNVDPLVVLANHCSRWGDYQKSITLIRLAKTLEPDHPDLEFHELSYQYYNAGKNQDMSGIHTACAAIDRYMQSHDLNAFKTLTVAKVFASLSNLDLALETLEKNKAVADKSISYQLLHLLCYTEKNVANPEIMRTFQDNLADLSRKDPNNHELLALLSRHMGERKKYLESAELALQALRGVRFIQEFTIRYQDVLAAFAFAGLPLPHEDFPPYAGPDHIKVTSEEWSKKFEADNVA